MLWHNVRRASALRPFYFLIMLYGVRTTEAGGPRLVGQSLSHPLF